MEEQLGSLKQLASKSKEDAMQLQSKREQLRKMLEEHKNMAEVQKERDEAKKQVSRLQSELDALKRKKISQTLGADRLLKEQVSVLEGRVQQLQTELELAHELLRSMKIQVSQREREVARTYARKPRN